MSVLFKILRISSTWFPDEHNIYLLHTSKIKNNISVDLYLQVGTDMLPHAFYRGDLFLISKNSCISDIREGESLLSEISFNSLNIALPSNESSDKYHISQAKIHVSEAINILRPSNLESHMHSPDCPEISRLEFIMCQLENCNISIKARRYNIITQILAIKAHLFSPSCYRYLQTSNCISLPHSHTLGKLYSSIGLEHDLSVYLKKATSGFSLVEKNVIVQMDEIHVKPDISIKTGKLFGTYMNIEDPTETVFAIMVSSLHRKWSCIARLLPCSSISADKIFPTVKSCIMDIENCGLKKVHVLCTDNYPLNVNLFKLFSPIGILQTQVPHPYDSTRNLYIIFDIVHILKTIRNNWLN